MRTLREYDVGIIAGVGLGLILGTVWFDFYSPQDVIAKDGLRLIAAALIGFGAWREKGIREKKVESEKARKESEISN
jgi:hypothetical protein